ncbi:hypothetical protein Tco_1221007 [Tanacetum coccineum]
MKKRRQSSKIINCDVLTKKGPISLKVYREDGIVEVIEKFKASDLQMAEWRELVQVCPDRKEKGWKTIYELIKTRMEYLEQTKKELHIKFNKSLQEQDPLDELNDLANKKIKRTGDSTDHSRLRFKFEGDNTPIVIQPPFYSASKNPFLKHDDSLAESMNTPSKEDLDNLFGPMYEEYFEKRSSEVSINSVAKQVHNHEDSPLTSSVIIEDHEIPPIVTTSDK